MFIFKPKIDKSSVLMKAFFCDRKLNRFNVFLFLFRLASFYCFGRIVLNHWLEFFLIPKNHSNRPAGVRRGPLGSLGWAFAVFVLMGVSGLQAQTDTVGTSKYCPTDP